MSREQLLRTFIDFVCFLRQTITGRRRDNTAESLYLLVHSPNRHNGQGSTRLRSEPRVPCWSPTWLKRENVKDKDVDREDS